MNTALIFKTMCYDKISLTPGSTNCSFFQDIENEFTPSVREYSESEIVRWLLENPSTRQFLFEELIDVTPYTQWRTEIRQPLIPTGFTETGDVDILLCDSRITHEAIAIECKRVKVLIEESGKERINKIQELDKGVIQANGLRSLGFHKSYLAIIIVHDGRYKTETNHFFRYGTSEEISSTVYQLPKHNSIHAYVGVLYIQITQPTDKIINESATIGICVDKTAIGQEQPATLTSHIKSLFARS